MMVRLRQAVLYSGVISSVLVLVYMYMTSGSRSVLYRDKLDQVHIELPNPRVHRPHVMTTLAPLPRLPPRVVHQNLTVDANNGQSLSFEEHMNGRLNFDVWHWIVGYLVDDMRLKPSYPNYPDERKTTDTLHVEFSEKDPNDNRGRYAHKIYGYLLPDEKGKYTFIVEMSGLTAACTVELWISTDADPMNMQRMLTLEYQEENRPEESAKRSKDSSSILLDNNSHYFEFLEKAFDGQCIVDVKWKPPTSSSFSPIPSSHFAMAVRFDTDGRLLDSSIVQVLQGPLPSNALQDHHRAHFIGDTIYPITDLDVLPKCEFIAEYARKQTLKLYDGFKKLLFESDVYPGDDTEMKITMYKENNAIIEIETVDKVLSMYKKALKDSDKYDGEVISLRSLERTKNKNKGFRFLLELDINLKSKEASGTLTDKTVHTSEYVYLPNDGSGLCHTANFQWTKDVDVHFLVTLKNLGPWAVHLIQNMEYVYSQTEDDHFSLVVVDVDSKDIDIEAEFRKSSFKRWHVIKLKGDFVKPVAYQAGLDYIQDPDSIVMTFDMHLSIPPGFIEYTRRHVVKNKMAFVPMVFRLQPGYTEVNWKGFWEIWGTGLFAMYKSDFESFGFYRGMDKYKEWGGEDWKLLDRAMEHGYEAYRLRCPGLVHYHHTKNSIWSENRHENFADALQ